MRAALCVLMVLFGLACASSPKIGPVHLGEFGPVLDDLWTTIGKREIVVCLDAVEREAGWEVTRVVLPVQQGDSVSVSFKGCADYPGWGHNHPILGGRFGERPNCILSDVDLESIRSQRAAFHVLWCAPGVIYAVKVSQ